MTGPRQGILNALDGICYVVDPDGRVLEVGEPAWSDSLRQIGAAPIPFVGRNLFDMIRGPDVRATYRTLHDAILSGARPHVSFELRCDAPDAKRLLRLSISALRDSGAPAILYQSQVLSAVSRPWMSLFDPARIVENIRRYAGLQIVRVCSICQRVAQAIQGGENWIEAEDYYRGGGPADVQVSHGVCPACADRLAPPDPVDRS